MGDSLTTDLRSLGRRIALDEEEVRHALTRLEKAGAIRVRRPFSGRAIRTLDQCAFRDLGLNLATLRDQERRALLLLKRMTDYAYAKRCRRAFVLRYFGERMATAECGQCDTCAGPRVKRPTKAVEEEETTSKGQGGKHSALAFSELKRWRWELSQSLGIPPYIIFTDKALVAISTTLPVDREGFLALKGTGETRWERFGPHVTRICQMVRAAGDAPLPVPPAMRRGRTK